MWPVIGVRLISCTLAEIRNVNLLIHQRIINTYPESDQSHRVATMVFFVFHADPSHYSALGNHGRQRKVQSYLHPSGSIRAAVE